MPFKSLKTISTIIKGANSPESNAAYEAQGQLVDAYKRLEPQVPSGNGKVAMTKFLAEKEKFKENDPKHNNSAGESLWIQTLNALSAETALPPELKHAVRRCVNAEKALDAVVDRRIAGLDDKDLAKEIKSEDKQRKVEKKQEKKEAKKEAKEARRK